MAIDQAHVHERLSFRSCDVDDNSLVTPDQGRLIEVKDLDGSVAHKSFRLSNKIQAESFTNRKR